MCQNYNSQSIILGITAFFHTSSAALIVDGELIAAAEEERFTRIKYDASFPINAIAYCLYEAGFNIEQVDYITFFEKPLIKFERIISTFLQEAPFGFRSFKKALPTWLDKKLFIKKTINHELKKIASCQALHLPKQLYVGHHHSHAAAAFFPSPFKKAAVLCIDAVGEWATTSVWIGEGANLQQLWQIEFPNSIGLLYSALTYYIGFRVNSAEYKVMGLAPYGNPIYQNIIKKHLISIQDDGTYQINMKYFKFGTQSTMLTRAFVRLFKHKPRKPDTEISQFHKDIAASIQAVTEEIVIKLSKKIKQEMRINNLCMAGGVALNCVANGKLQAMQLFDDIWVQPAAGDSGSAVGAALAVYHQYLKKPRTICKHDSMKNAYLGPQYSNDDCKKLLNHVKANYVQLDDEQLFNFIVEKLINGAVIGWFQGRMEFGPRALGNRSILADPRNPAMQKILNLKIKFRESFRPFAPVILEECVTEYIENGRPSHYMTFVGVIQKKYRKQPQVSSQDKTVSILDERSNISAVTHLDYSARYQTVSQESNFRFYCLIKKFYEHTGVPILINTSFNIRGEPIVEKPKDAWRCFMRTGMDYLALNNCVLSKCDQDLNLLNMKDMNYAVIQD